MTNAIHNIFLVIFFINAYIVICGWKKVETNLDEKILINHLQSLKLKRWKLYSKITLQHVKWTFTTVLVLQYKIMNMNVNINNEWLSHISINELINNH